MKESMPPKLSTCKGKDSPKYLTWNDKMLQLTHISMRKTSDCWFTFDQPTLSKENLPNFHGICHHWPRIARLGELFSLLDVKDKLHGLCKLGTIVTRDHHNWQVFFQACPTIFHEIHEIIPFLWSSSLHQTHLNLPSFNLKTLYLHAVASSTPVVSETPCVFNYLVRRVVKWIPLL